MQSCGKNDTTDHEFIPSGDIDIKGFGQNIRIGFKYVGDKQQIQLHIELITL